MDLCIELTRKSTIQELFDWKTMNNVDDLASHVRLNTELQVSKELVFNIVTVLEAELKDRVEAGDEGEFISIRHHGNVQILLECISCWVFYPFLAFERGVFGVLRVGGMEDLAKTFVNDIKGVSKSLKLSPERLFQGFTQQQFGLDDVELVQKCMEILKTYSMSDYFAHFALEKFYPDLLLMEASFGEIQDEKEISVGVVVGCLLRALQIQVKMTNLFKPFQKPEPGNNKLVSKRLGIALGNMVKEEGGVKAVISEMLVNIPHGNLRAFVKVSELLLEREENLQAVCEQIIRILWFAETSDKDRSRAALLKRSAVITVNMLARKYGPERVQALFLKPLLKSIHATIQQEEPDESKVEEVQLMQEICILRTLLEAGPSDPNLLLALEPSMAIIFELYCFAQLNHVRGDGDAKSVLWLWIEKTRPERVAHVLRVFALTPSPIGMEKFQVDQQKGGFFVELRPSSPATTDQKEDVKLRLEKRSEHEVLEQEGGPRVKFVMQILENGKPHEKKVQGQLFVQSLQDLTVIWKRTSPDVVNNINVDIDILRVLLGGSGDGEEEEVENDTFSFSENQIQVKALVNSMVTLLSTCTSALQLWEDYEGDTSSSSVVDLNEKVVLALEVAPLFLAIVASLASHDANDELWLCQQEEEEGEQGRPHPYTSRYQVLEPLIPSLIALSRAGPKTAHLAVKGVHHVENNMEINHKLYQRFQELCNEIAESAMVVRMKILTSNNTIVVDKQLEKVAEQEAEEDTVIIDPIGKKIAEAKAKLLNKKNEPHLRAMSVDILRDIAKQSASATNGASAPKPSERHMKEIVDIMLAGLLDSDPYVYLTSIRALSSACETNVGSMFDRFILIFENSEAKLSFNGRLRLGEVLMMAIRRSGALLPHFAPKLIRSFCAGASMPLIQDTRQQQQARDEEMQLVVGNSFRASCLSNLAEICGLAPWAAFRYVGMITSLGKGILQCETNVEEALPARRAASFMFLQLVKGAAALENNQAIHEIPKELKEINRIVNAVSTYDKDPVVRFHADCARGTFDELMKKFIFPPERPKVLEVGILNKRPK